MMKFLLQDWDYLGMIQKIIASVMLKDKKCKLQRSCAVFLPSH